MFLLSLGLILFIAIHLTPSFPAFRQKMIDRLGEMGYKGVFSLISLAGLVILVKGKAAASFVEIWEPFSWARHLTMLLMIAAIILFISARPPTNIKRFTPNPLSWAIILWSVGHLMANGDLASLILFGGLGLFAIVSMNSSNKRGARKLTTKVAVKNDIILVVIGLVIYGALVKYHGNLFGVALF